MHIESRFRGRDITSDDVEFIRQLIAGYPRLSRRALSVKLCDAWKWFQPNGTPRDMVARGLMLHLHRAGLIELPVQKRLPPNNVVRHQRPEASLLLAWPVLEGPLAKIRPVEIRQVRRTGDEGLFNSFIQAHHYLG